MRLGPVIGQPNHHLRSLNMTGCRGYGIFYLHVVDLSGKFLNIPYQKKMIAHRTGFPCPPRKKQVPTEQKQVQRVESLQQVKHINTFFHMTKI